MFLRLIILILLVPFFGFTQNIVFSDINLKNKLLQSNAFNQIAEDSNGNNFKIDSNNDNEISINEALSVYKLEIDISNISNISSLTNFYNLAYLYVAQNNLNELDLSLFPNLIFINAAYNQITEFEVVGNSKLEGVNLNNCQLTHVKIENCVNLFTFEFIDNQITSIQLNNLPSLFSFNLASNFLTNLNLTNYQNLKFINVSNNALQSLIVNQCPQLIDVDCSLNQLSNLNFKNFSNLRDLYCFNNNLSTINLKGCSSLKKFFAFNNFLSNVDLSSCSSLYEIDLDYNNLEYLNIKNGIHENSFRICQNPNLKQVCVDVSPEEYDHMYFQLVSCEMQDAVEIINDCVVAIEESTEDIVNEFMIYPNPFTDQMVFRCKNDDSIKTISIYDNCSKLIKQIDYFDQNKIVTLYLSEVSTGVYYCVIDTSNDKILRKIIKI